MRSESSKANKRESHKAWVKAHPEHVRAYAKAWATAHPESMKTYREKFDKSHPGSMKAYRQKNYGNNREYYLQVAKSARRRRFLFLNGLKKSCQICGENDLRCLDFHHRDPSTKLFAPGTGTRSMDKLLEEVGKCDVLCANCHRKLHFPRES